MTREEKQTELDRLYNRLRRFSELVNHLEGRIDPLIGFQAFTRAIGIATQINILAAQPTDDMKIDSIYSGGI